MTGAKKNFTPNENNIMPNPRPNPKSFAK